MQLSDWPDWSLIVNRNSPSPFFSWCFALWQGWIRNNDELESDKSERSQRDHFKIYWLAWLAAWCSGLAPHLGFFLSIYFGRREIGPLRDWYDNNEQRVSRVWIFWFWQGSSQHCCVGWSLVVWIKSRLVADFWRRLLCGLGKFAESLDLHTFDHYNLQSR